jgi:uncharacterized protein YndB with AHSA1/START domain
MAFSVVVVFPQSPEVVFAYLKDPRNRPAWQSSLRGVEDVVGAGDVGTTWTDVTIPGLRPHLHVTDCDQPSLWAEEGVWRSVTARLEVHLKPHRGGGTTLKAVVDFTTPGLLTPVGWFLRVATPAAVRADLRKAAQLIDQQTDR